MRVDIISYSRELGLSPSGLKKIKDDTADKKVSRLAQALKDETKNPIDEFKVAMNNLKIAGAELGEALQKALGPIIKEVIEKLKGFTKWFSSLSQGQKEFIIKIGLLAAAVGPVVVVFSKLTQGVGGFVIKMAGLSTKITQAGSVMSALSGGMASLL